MTDIVKPILVPFVDFLQAAKPEALDGLIKMANHEPELYGKICAAVISDDHQGLVRLADAALPAAPIGKAAADILTSRPAKWAINTGLDAASRGTRFWNKVVPAQLNPFGARAQQVVDDVKDGAMRVQRGLEDVKPVLDLSTKHRETISDMLRSTRSDPDFVRLKAEMQDQKVRTFTSLTLQRLDEAMSKQ